MTWFRFDWAPRQAAIIQSVRGVNYSSSPLLAARTPPLRSRIVLMLLSLGFVVLVVRALFIQVIDTDFYLERGAERYASTMKLPASRGRVLDRNGQILAVSIRAPTIALDPVTFAKDAKPGQPEDLARLLGSSLPELQARIRQAQREAAKEAAERQKAKLLRQAASAPAPEAQALRQAADGVQADESKIRYVVLRRQMDADVADRIAQLRIPGLVIVPDYLRRYPEGEAAAHLVGFTSVLGEGQEGIELKFEEQLKGEAGSRGVLRDRLGRVVEDLGEPVEPRNGQDISLTIDSKVQALAYQRLRDAVLDHRAKAGSVVVLDAQSGDILALANYPSFQPEERRNLTGAQLRNRAITDVFEPGSTVKPFVVTLGLEKGVVSPDTVLDTVPFRVNNLLVNDGEHGRPSMSVAQVVQRSSNVGTVRIAQKLDDRDMGEMFRALGFGQRPKIGFPGAVAGRLRPWEKWRPTEKATMSYGYGLSVSLLQIARAYTALARDGELAPLSLIKKNDNKKNDEDTAADPNSGTTQEKPVRIFQPEAARAMRAMLRGTVGPEGTAPKAQPIGYTAGGKTGTAQAYDENTGYSRARHRAWFAGIAPIHTPRVVVAVMIDEPTGEYYGGLVAAPVFKVVVEQALRSLGVPPDLEIPPTTARGVAQAGPAAAPLTRSTP